MNKNIGLLASIGGKAKHAKYSQNGIDNPNYKHGLRVNNKRHHDKIYRLVRTGIETKQIRKGECEICFKREDVFAHHNDYSEPYKIRWLCRIHHAQVHKLKGQVDGAG